jgi:hypothetical protein
MAIVRIQILVLVALLGWCAHPANASDDPPTVKAFSSAIDEVFQRECTAAGCDYRRIAIGLQRWTDRQRVDDSLSEVVRQAVTDRLRSEVKSVLQTRIEGESFAALQASLDRTQGLFRFTLTTSALTAVDRQAVLESSVLALNDASTNRNLPETWGRWYGVAARMAVEDPNNSIDNSTLEKFIEPALAWGFAQSNSAFIVAILRSPSELDVDKHLAGLDRKSAEATKRHIGLLKTSVDKLNFQGFGRTDWLGVQLRRKLDEGDFSASFWRRFGGELPGYLPAPSTAARLFTEDLAEGRWKAAEAWALQALDSAEDASLVRVRKQVLEAYSKRCQLAMDLPVGDPALAELSLLRVQFGKRIPEVDRTVAEVIITTITRIAESDRAEKDREVLLLSTISRGRDIGLDVPMTIAAVLEAANKSGVERLPLYWNVGRTYLRTVGEEARSAGFEESIIGRAAEKQSWPFLYERAVQNQISMDLSASLRGAIESALDRAAATVPPPEAAVLFYLKVRPTLNLRDRWQSYLEHEGKQLKLRLEFDAARAKNDYVATSQIASELRRMESPAAAAAEDEAMQVILNRIEMDPLRSGEGEILGRAFAALAERGEEYRDRLLLAASAHVDSSFEEWVGCLESARVISRTRMIEVLVPIRLGPAERGNRLVVLTSRWGAADELKAPWGAAIADMAVSRDWQSIRRLYSDDRTSAMVRPILSEYLDAKLKDRSTLMVACETVRSVLAESLEPWAVSIREQVTSRLAQELKNPGEDPMLLEGLLAAAKGWPVDTSTIDTAVQQLVLITPLTSDRLDPRVRLLLAANDNPNARAAGLYSRVLRVLVAAGERDRASAWRDAGLASGAFSEADAATLDVVRRWDVDRAKEQVVVDAFAFDGKWSGVFLVEDSNIRTAIELTLKSKGNPLLTTPSGSMQVDKSDVAVSSISLDRKKRRVTILLASRTQMHPAFKAKSLWTGTFRLVGEKAGQIEIELDHEATEPRAQLVLTKGT